MFLTNFPSIAQCGTALENNTLLLHCALMTRRWNCTLKRVFFSSAVPHCAMLGKNFRNIFFSSNFIKFYTALKLYTSEYFSQVLYRIALYWEKCKLNLYSLRRKEKTTKKNCKLKLYTFSGSLPRQERAGGPRVHPGPEGVQKDGRDRGYRRGQATAGLWCVVVVRRQQGKNGKEAREQTEGKSGRVHRGR